MSTLRDNLTFIVSVSLRKYDILIASFLASFAKT